MVNNVEVESTDRRRRAIRRCDDSVRRRGFTLVELLVTVVIIAILASMVMFALAGAVDKAYAAQTKSRIAKIDRVISRMWRDYETRRVPIRIPSGTHPIFAARMRLDALRELMRLEMPDRITDIQDAPIVLVNPDNPEGGNNPNLFPTSWRSALNEAYRRTANANGWDADSPEARRFQGAECLYLILSKAKDGGRPAIAGFSEDSIGDVDGDGMPEILDAWGNPIEFLRWPTGLSSPINSTAEHDPFDRRKVDPDAFLTYPLIYSPGQDRQYNIASENVENAPISLSVGNKVSRSKSRDE